MPAKYYPPLQIYSDGVKSVEIAFQLLQSIRLQLGKVRCADHFKFPTGDSLQFKTKTTNRLSLPDQPGFFRPEWHYHSIVRRY